MSERLRASVWFDVFHPPTQQASQPATAKELLLHQARPARQGTLGWGVFRSVHTTHLPGRKNTQTAGKAPYPKWRRMVVHVRVVHLRTRPVNSIVLRDCYVRSSLVDRPDGFVPSWAELLWLQLAAFLFVFVTYLLVLRSCENVNFSDWAGFSQQDGIGEECLIM